MRATLRKIDSWIAQQCKGLNTGFDFRYKQILSLEQQVGETGQESVTGRAEIPVPVYNDDSYYTLYCVVYIDWMSTRRSAHYTP